MRLNSDCNRYVVRGLRMGYISPEIPTATLLLSCFKQTFPCQVAKYPEAFGGRLAPSILSGQPPQFWQVSPLNFSRLAPSILGQPPRFWQVSPLNFGRLAPLILVYSLQLWTLIIAPTITCLIPRTYPASSHLHAVQKYNQTFAFWF